MTRPRTVMSCNECRTKKKAFSGLGLRACPARAGEKCRLNFDRKWAQVDDIEKQMVLAIAA